MPKGCSLFSPEVMHRDLLMCNPHNTGHYRYPRFENLSYDEGCHCREINALLNKQDSDKYVIFYTRHVDLYGNSKSKIIGYFKVGRCFNAPKRGFVASDILLLPKHMSIEINYSSRGVPVSWGKSSVKCVIDDILCDMMNNRKHDISSKYQSETEQLTASLKTLSGRRHIIETCQRCKFRSQCYWGRKLKHDKEQTMDRLYEGEKNSC